MSPDCQELKVLEIIPYGQSDFFELRLEHPGWKWEPGQFAMLRPGSWGNDPIWARPFSICREDQDGISFFIQVVGRGTAALRDGKPGQKITVWGPLGNSFAVEPDTPTLILAGGIGLAPFVGYVMRHPKPGNLRLVFGHRFPVKCFPFDLMSGLIECENLHQHTAEDLEAHIEIYRQRVNACSGGLVLACGPRPFLRLVKQSAALCGARAQVSLENRMACGVGACLGCVTRVPGEALPVQVCTHGPVFWADQVILDED